MGDTPPYMHGSLLHGTSTARQLFTTLPQGNWRSLELVKHHSALGLASALKPVQPVTLIRPHAAQRAARFFVEKFPGRSIYAVKANPSPDLITLLSDSGITHFDVASIAEVRLVAGLLPDATLCFIDRKSVV